MTLPSSASDRCQFLRRCLTTSVVLGAGPALWGCAEKGSPRSAAAVDMRRMKSNIPSLAGSLRETTVENDPETRVLLPPGFTLREVARTGHAPIPGSGYLWHPSPDGGAVFAMDDGGWVYVSNSEIDIFRHGGVGALRFDRYVDDHLQVDFRGSYRFLQHYQVFFNAINLNDEPFFAYFENSRFASQYEEYGRTFETGIKVTY